jgi:hypothetical protein
MERAASREQRIEIEDRGKQKAVVRCLGLWTEEERRSVGEVRFFVPQIPWG